MQAWLALRVIREGDCALWVGAKDRDGYPAASIAGRVVRPHRIVCYALNGEPHTPRARTRHTCDRPSCIEPAHLIWGTPRDNAQDMLARGRATPTVAEGRRPILRLTERQLDAVRVDTRPLATIAAELGCSVKTVAKIRGGRRGTGHVGRLPKL